MFAAGEPAVDVAFAGLRSGSGSTTLSWIDDQSGWLHGPTSCSATLVERGAVAAAPGRDVGQLRRRAAAHGLVADRGRPTTCPRPSWPTCGRRWASRYGVRFTSLGANLYRHGRDSVAWHGDRIGRTAVEPVVAIVSLGEPRPFLVRPRGGGPSLSYEPGGGDLFVMGGRCQHDWEHTVPKVAVGRATPVAHLSPRCTRGRSGAVPFGSRAGSATVAMPGAQNCHQPRRTVI